MNLYIKLRLKLKFTSAKVLFYYVLNLKKQIYVKMTCTNFTDPPLFFYLKEKRLIIK